MSKNLAGSSRNSPSVIYKGTSLCLAYGALFASSESYKSIYEKLNIPPSCQGLLQGFSDPACRNRIIPESFQNRSKIIPDVHFFTSTHRAPTHRAYQTKLARLFGTEHRPQMKGRWAVGPRSMRSNVESAFLGDFPQYKLPAEKE